MKQRYNIMLNPTVVSKIDIHAAKLDMSRSELINYILYDQLQQYGEDPDDSEPDIADQIFLPDPESREGDL